MLIKFYQQFFPDRLGSVAAIMQQFEGREAGNVVRRKIRAVRLAYVRERV